MFGGATFGLEKSTEYESAEAASAELERFVTRREKIGFKVQHRLAESPWLDWVDGLERMHQRVVADAQRLQIPITVGQTYFQRGAPSTEPLVDVVGAELAELALVTGLVRMQWVVGDPQRLQFRKQFTVSIATNVPVHDGATRLWHDDGDSHGLIVNGAIANYDGDSEIATLAPTEFRAWFPGYIRDDVMGFAIAELSR